jgi:hypothetical protein
MRQTRDLHDPFRRRGYPWGVLGGDMRGSKVVLGVCAAWMLACTGKRDVGPNEDEFGKVLFWEVLSFDTTTTDCTNSPDFQTALVPPSLEEGTFFIYALSDDGQSATVQDCTQNRAETCTPVPEYTLQPEGNELLFAGEPQKVDAGRNCDLRFQEFWRFVDAGEDGTLDMSLTFSFDGLLNDCDTYDEAIAAGGTNGYGLADCEVTVSAELAFSNAD